MQDMLLGVSLLGFWRRKPSVALAFLRNISTFDITTYTYTEYPDTECYEDPCLCLKFDLNLQGNKGLCKSPYLKRNCMKSCDLCEAHIKKGEDRACPRWLGFLFEILLDM